MLLLIRSVVMKRAMENRRRKPSRRRSGKSQGGAEGAPYSKGLGTSGVSSSDRSLVEGVAVGVGIGRGSSSIGLGMR